MCTSSSGPTTHVTCLLKNTGNCGASMPRLGDVVGVVEPDGQELARLHGSQQAHLLQRMALVGVVAVDDVAVLDDPVARTGAGVEATEPHEDISGISTGACSGA